MRVHFMGAAAGAPPPPLPPRCLLLLGRLVFLALALDGDGDGDLGGLDGRLGQGRLHRQHPVGGQRGPHGRGLHAGGEAAGERGRGWERPRGPGHRPPCLGWWQPRCVRAGVGAGGDGRCEEVPRVPGGFQAHISSPHWYLRVFSGEAPGDEAVLILFLLVLAWKRETQGRSVPTRSPHSGRAFPLPRQGLILPIPHLSALPPARSCADPQEKPGPLQEHPPSPRAANCSR